MTEMDNLKKYKQVFMDNFYLMENELDNNFTNQNIQNWDSIGHMNLISMLEESFDIFFENEDIMNLVSYDAGQEILEKYGVFIKSNE